MPGRSKFLSVFLALLAAGATVALLQRCFMVPAAPPLPTSSLPTLKARQQATSGLARQLAVCKQQFPREFDDIDPALVLGGEALLSKTASLPFASSDEASSRQINVAVWNAKHGKRDKSPGWTLRKKYRKCSLLARTATTSGAKIVARQVKRGKKTYNLGPGDYKNTKMQRTVRP
eukprot:TRINITY_DN101236_c0_g1_i1.p1 TRINITY_DN101236_c0_g1~~TRINITY_DN101236_c0_g1_i1.p1  ORF type:complete len:175 (-),score=30.09 TRINITY_DN101236_c0_g1_i1:218-742(-)